INVGCVEGVVGQVIGLAVGIKYVADQGQPMSWCPHSYGCQRGGISEIRGLRSFIEVKVREVVSVAITKYGLVKSRQDQDPPQDKAEAWAEGLEQIVFRRKNVMGQQRTGQGEPVVMRDRGADRKSTLRRPSKSRLQSDMSQATRPKAGAPGVYIDGKVSVLHEGHAGFDGAGRHALLRAGRIEIQKNSTAVP